MDAFPNFNYSKATARVASILGSEVGTNQEIASYATDELLAQLGLSVADDGSLSQDLNA